MEEKKRYINNLYSVFDLPEEGGLTVEGNEPTRVMMLYDRDLNMKEYKILNKSLSSDVKKRITPWLQENSHIYDTMHGIT